MAKMCFQNVLTLQVMALKWENALNSHPSLIPWCPSKGLGIPGGIQAARVELEGNPWEFSKKKKNPPQNRETIMEPNN